MRWTVVMLGVALTTTLSPSAHAAASIAPSDRAGIDRTLDVFVPSAIGRRDSAASWPLVTAKMRVGSDKASWTKGFLPVPPFPVIGKTFHGWTVNRVHPGQVDITLLVHLKKGAPLGAVSFDVTMRRLHGRWLVDSAVPAATFAPAGSDSKVLAQPDFAPQGGQAFSKTGRISQKWVLIIPGVLLGLIVLTPIAVITAHRVRDRKVRRRNDDDQDRGLGIRRKGQYTPTKG
jgi:hypothetical protein